MDLHGVLLTVAVRLVGPYDAGDGQRGGAPALGEWPIDAFPPGFFDRSDPSPDDRFYSWSRLVTHIDDAAIAANPQASGSVVHDLNADPTLPFADESFDAAVCCVSVDYLTRPVEVFAEVRRVLRPGRVFVCTFSNQ